MRFHSEGKSMSAYLQCLHFDIFQTEFPDFLELKAKQSQFYLENKTNISSNQFLADFIDLKIKIPDGSTVV